MLHLAQLGDHEYLVVCLAILDEMNNIWMTQLLEHVCFVAVQVELLFCLSSLGNHLKSHHRPGSPDLSLKIKIRTLLRLVERGETVSGIDFVNFAVLPLAYEQQSDILVHCVCLGFCSV